MRTKRSLLRWIAAGLIILASFLAISQLTRYSRIRANFPTGLKIAGIPVIIISNSGQPLELERAKELGAVDWLVKTEFDPKEVAEKIQKYIRPTD